MAILNDVKRRLNIPEEVTDFDLDIIDHINNAFFAIWQMGIPRPGERPYAITGAENEWSEFTGEADDLEPIKTYVYLKTRLVFDPPASSAAVEAIKERLAETEWRLYINEDTKRLE
ncbi:MAG: hypothetical protein IIZ07_08220 [Ruminococcus sp.]|nr:hypothetical protein [Ruminococcus sp.]